MTYSYEEDKERYRREKKRQRKLRERLSGKEFEPRRYSKEDRDFAERLNSGARFLSDGESE